MSTVATPAPVPRRGRRRTKLQRRQTRLGWFLLVPALAVVALVALYPLAKTIYQSFTNQEFLGLSQTKSVGIDNYRALWHDTIFRDTVVLTIKFTAITVAFEFVLGLIIALVVNSSFKGRGVMRAVMLVPWAIPTVVAAQMWKWMLDDTYGVVNDLGVRTTSSPTRTHGSPTPPPHWRPSARSTSGRPRHSSRSCCSPGCR